MFRTELPHASRVVRPGLGEVPHRRLGIVQRHEVELHVLAGRDVTEAARMPLGDVRQRVELRGVEDALRNLDPQHLRIGVLPLPVGAAQQPERAPLVRRDLAALEPIEHQRRTRRCRRCRQRTAGSGRRCEDRLMTAMILSRRCGSRADGPRASRRRVLRRQSCRQAPPTAPTTMMPGQIVLVRQAILASQSRRACRARRAAPGRDAPTRIAAGVRARPAGIERAPWRSPRGWPSPISTTIVALPGCSERSTGRTPIRRGPTRRRRRTRGRGA